MRATLKMLALTAVAGLTCTSLVMAANPSCPARYASAPQGVAYESSAPLVRCYVSPRLGIKDGPELSPGCEQCARGASSYDLPDSVAVYCAPEASYRVASYSKVAISANPGTCRAAAPVVAPAIVAPVKPLQIRVLQPPIRLSPVVVPARIAPPQASMQNAQRFQSSFQSRSQSNNMQSMPNLQAMRAPARAAEHSGSEKIPH
ncbi:MAG TPA: hypothetical protein VIG51_09580 [Candidatus Baltobacteraceae bacterium]